MEAMNIDDAVGSAGADQNVVEVSPINRLKGELRLPGDKSISHRAAIIAWLAGDKSTLKSTLKNFSTAQDCEATIECLRALGADIRQTGSTVVVQPYRAEYQREQHLVLNARNSGTTMRLLAGILAARESTITITGDESLLQRPMLRVAEPLRLMGAVVELGPNNCGPIRITGIRWPKEICYRPSVASAQVKSAVLLAAAAGRCKTTIEEPTKTRDHTERLLEEFGWHLRRNDKQIVLFEPDFVHSCDLVIPGDISSAAFFIAAAVALPGSDLLITDVLLNPTRTAFISRLIELGANIELTNQRLEHLEIVGTVRVRGVPLNNTQTIEVSGHDIPGLIDELSLLGFLAASVGCEMNLRDAKELRVKESDRITATVTNLSSMGAEIEEREDGWRLHAGKGLQGAQLSSFGDHRIAMACAIAALTAAGPSQIEGGRSAVGVSLPEFWSLLKSVSE